MAVIDKIKNERVTPNVTYDIGASAENVAYSESTTYSAGSVGKAVTDLKEDLSQLGLTVVNGKICCTYLVES